MYSVSCKDYTLKSTDNLYFGEKSYSKRTEFFNIYIYVPFKNLAILDNSEVYGYIDHMQLHTMITLLYNCRGLDSPKTLCRRSIRCSANDKEAAYWKKTESLRTFHEDWYKSELHFFFLT